jgi:VanZ family protein
MDRLKTMVFSKNVISLKSLMRLAGWIGFGLILILSLVPGNERPHTGATGQAEHFTAYLMTAAAYGYGCSLLRERLTWLAFLSAASALFEVIQLFIPGRNGQVIDWAASSLGACAGTVLGWLVWAVVSQAAKRSAMSADRLATPED